MNSSQDKGGSQVCLIVEHAAHVLSPVWILKNVARTW